MNMCFVQDADLEPKVAPWLIDKYICLLITFRLVTSVTSYVAVVTNDAVCTQGRIMCETRYVGYVCLHAQEPSSNHLYNSYTLLVISVHRGD